jgi:hypothetical protein
MVVTRRNTMTMRKCFKVMSLLLICVFAVSLAYAQEKKTGGDGITKKADGSYRSDAYDQSNRPEDDYLARFRAQDVVDDLITRNMDELYLIQVIVMNNSGKADWNTKFKEQETQYKKALEQYYKRNIVYASDFMKKNQEGIREILGLVIKDYTSQCDTLLNEAAAKVLELHMNPATRVNPDRQEQLESNHIRLRVAYGQIDDAAKAEREKYLPGAVYHLRVARAYAIAILEDLSKDKAEKDGISKKYQVEKADNLNRVFNEPKEEPKK